MQEKLDSIVSLLEAAKQPASQLVYLTPPENPEVPAHVRQGASIKPQTERLGVEATFNYDAERPSGGVSAHQVARPSGLAAVTTQREGRPSLHTSVDSIFSKDLEPSLAEAIELLCRFKTLFVQHFPFIVIPAAQSAQELRQDKPYLYRTIMMVAVCNQPVRQEAMGREILVEFSASLLLRAEKSIDLLQALLVYNAWFV